MKKLFYLSLFFVFTACAHAVKNQNTSLPAVEPTPQATPIVQKTPAPPVSNTPKIPTQKSDVSVKSYLNMPVPFTSQAPYAVWDDLHNEACEEASMIMADAFFHSKSLSKEIAERSIQNLVTWQTQNNYTVDVTSEEVAQILKDYFELKAQLSFEVSVQGIQKELNRGSLVIVPASGRELGNPNFRRPGPLYHMLVVRGYDDGKKEFITNDPGTRKGEGYRYKYDVLINAVHDWPKQGRGKDDVTEEEMNAGKRVMIVVNKD